MKIGIVTTWFERGAAYVSRQYRQALSSQHEVLIYARAGEEQARGVSGWDDEGVTWAPRQPHPIFCGFDLAHFRRWLESEELDCVFFNEQQWWEPVALCAELGMLTGAYIDYYTEATLPLFRCYDFVICNTRRHYDALAWHRQAHFIRWGTDLRLFRPREQARAEDEPTFFLSSGFSPRRKGCDLALEAFATLEGESRMVVHAQCDLRRELPELRELIDRLTATERLELVEETVPAPGLYFRGDVYVYPSRLDGIGLTLAEALASGLAVITSDCAPMNEFVDETRGALLPITRRYARSDGYYWPQCDASVDALSEQMRRYTTDGPRLRAHQRAARRFAEEALDWERNGAPLPEIFERSQRLPSASKSDSVAQARAHDAKVGRLSWRLYQRSPRLWRLAKKLFR